MEPNIYKPVSSIKESNSDNPYSGISIKPNRKHGTQLVFNQ